MGRPARALHQRNATPRRYARMALRLAPLVKIRGSGATIAAGASASRYARESPGGIEGAALSERATGEPLRASTEIRPPGPPARARDGRARRGCARAGSALPAPPP